MNRARKRAAQAILMALEAEEVSARGGFACMFFTAEEYESALISERRAQGRYRTLHSTWPMLAWVSCLLLVTMAIALSQ